MYVVRAGYYILKKLLRYFLFVLSFAYFGTLKTNATKIYKINIDIFHNKIFFHPHNCLYFWLSLFKYWNLQIHRSFDKYALLTPYYSSLKCYSCYFIALKLLGKRALKALPWYCFTVEITGEKMVHFLLGALSWSPWVSFRWMMEFMDGCLDLIDLMPMEVHLSHILAVFLYLLEFCTWSLQKCTSI